MGLSISALKKQYIAPDGSVVTVLDVPDFSIPTGQHVALVGTSGSGKTTLLHSIAGIITPDSGQILIDSPADGSVDVTKLPEAHRDVFRGRHIGYIFQTHHLLPGFTAMENVLLGMSFTGRSADPAWAKELLQKVGLSERLDYKPGKLSVGQQQRVAVARALANKPSLVLADEPTGALDSETAAAVLKLIRDLCTQVGASLLLVTHDRDIAGQFPRQVDLASINHAAKKVVTAA